MKKLIPFALLASAMIAGIALQHWLDSDPRKQADQLGLFLFDQPRVLSDFELVSHKGEPFTKKDLSDHWSLMFFGYTFCPDVCPNTMALMNKVKEAAASDKGMIDPAIIMVSVDPQRDTVERMNNYVTFFNEEFEGVTGPLDDIYNFSRELNIVFAHLRDTPEDTQYLVDHSGSIVLLDPQGRYRGFFRAPHSVENLAKALQLLDDL